MNTGLSRLPRTFLLPKIRTSAVSFAKVDRKLKLTSLLLVLFFLLSIGPVVTGQPTQDNAAALIAEAKALWKKAKQEQALIIIQKAITADPRNPAAYVQLALIHAAMGDDGKSRLAVEEALKIDPNYAPAHQQRASQLRRAKDYEGAIRQAKLALSLKPDREFEAYAHLTLGRTYEELKRYDEALNEYREAIRINPTDGSLHATLGSAFFSLNRYEEAENEFRRAVEIDPQDSSSVINLAGSLHNQGERDEAIRYYREYLRLEPNGSDRVAVEQRIFQLERVTQPLLLNQLLLVMAQQGDVANATALITKGADPNYKSSYDYQTPLSAAARKGNLELVKLLLSRGAKDEDGAAIANAYDSGHAEIEKLLQQATPQTPKTLNRILSTAVYKGDSAKAQAVIAAGADNLDAVLISAVDQKKELLEVVRVLLEKGARVNQPEAYRTPLTLAAAKGHVESVKLLLAKGADLNTKARDNMTPLGAAIYNDKVAVVRLLLAAGADPNVNNNLRAAAGAPWVFSRDEQPAKPSSEVLQLLLDKGANAKSPDGDSALMVANSAEKVKLLLNAGANPNAIGEYGLTPLLAGAKRGDAALVEALVSAGADANAKDSQGDTPLLEALAADESYSGPQKIVKDYPAVVRAMLRAKNINVNAQNENGETALMRAVRLGDVESVRLLINAGADANLPDDIGDTAFIVAYEEGNAAIEALLANAAKQQLNPRTINAFLSAAIRKKDAAKVKELLDKGADPNYHYPIGLANQSITSTVLVRAAQAGDSGIVQMLLDKGADVNAKGLLYGSESGLVYGTALEAAKDPQVIEILKKAAKKAN